MHTGPEAVLCMSHDLTHLTLIILLTGRTGCSDHHCHFAERKLRLREIRAIVKVTHLTVREEGFEQTS